MKGKLAVVGSLALALAGAAPAAAQDAHRDITLESGKALMEVKVPSLSLYDQLYSSYDFVEAMQRNGDGSVSTDVLVNPEEQAALRAQGVQFVRTLETDATTERRVDERDAALAREDARAGPRGAGGAGREPERDPAARRGHDPARVHVHELRGPLPLRRGAHEGRDARHARRRHGSPTMALSFAGADGVFGPASNMPIFRDNETGPPNSTSTCTTATWCA